MSSRAATVVGIAALTTTLGMFDGGFGPTATAVASLVVWWTVIVGVAASLWPNPLIRRSAIAAGLAIGGLAALSGASMIWAQADQAALEEANKLLAYTGLFVLVVATSEKVRGKDILYGIALGFVVITGIALLSRFEPSWISDGADQALAASNEAAQGRLSYPIGYWNGLAACLAIGATLLAWIGAIATTRLVRAGAIASLALVGLALYLTGSRGGILATVIGFAVLLARAPERSRIFAAALPGFLGAGVLIGLASQRSELVDALSPEEVGSQGDEMLVASAVVTLVVGIAAYLLDSRAARVQLPRRPVTATLATLGLAAVVAFVITGPQKHLDNFTESSDGSALEDGGAAGNFDSSSGSGRYQFWEVGFEAFARDPALGVGAGNYVLEWNVEGETGAVVQDAHSLYIEVIAELGAAGGVLLLLFGAAVVWAARHPSGARATGLLAAPFAVFAAGATSALLDWTYEIPAAFAPLVVSGALLVRTGTWAERDPRTRFSKSPSFGLGVMALLAAWSAVWISGVVLVGEVQLSESRASVERADLDQAAEHAVFATEVQPWSEEAYIQLAQVELLRGNEEAALEAASVAVERNRKDWRTWFVLAQMRLGSGDVTGTRDALAQARDLSPRPISASSLSLE
jgi:hypothetical protein